MDVTNEDFTESSSESSLLLLLSSDPPLRLPISEINNKYNEIDEMSKCTLTIVSDDVPPWLNNVATNLQITRKKTGKSGSPFTPVCPVYLPVLSGKIPAQVTSF